MSETIIPKGWKGTSISELLNGNSLYCDGDWVESKDQDEKGNNRLIQLADIGDGLFLNKSNRFMNNKQFQMLHCTKLKEGDILIARMPDPIGRACIFRKLSTRCATVVDVAILRNPNADVYWLTSMINSSNFRREIENLSNGTTRTRITRGFLAGIRFNIPNIDSQKMISAILKSLDQTIEKTEVLIHKYQQIKAGLMYDLFTRGVTADGKLRPPKEQTPELYKETPIGRIPKEWKIKSLKDLYKYPIRDFGSFSSTNLISFLNEGVPFIKSEMVKEESIDWTNVFYISKKVHKLLAKSHVSEGQILFSKIGSALGKAVLYKGDRGICNSNAAIAKIEVDKQSVIPMFVEMFLNSRFAKSQFDLMIISLLPRINLGDINKLFIPIPSLDEQKILCEKYLFLKLKISSEKSYLRKLKNQKSGLMHDLLTGKVQVKAGQEEPAHV